MPDLTQYGRPEWWIGVVGWSGPNRCMLYAKQLKFHLYGGDVGGSIYNETENFELDPPGRDDVIDEFRGKYGNRLSVGDTWYGQRYIPRDQDWEWVYGEGTTFATINNYKPWSYGTIENLSELTWTWQHGLDSWDSQYISHTSNITDDHTGSSRGSFSSSNFTWTAGSGTSSKSAANWENEVRSVETDIAAAVAVNGRYPVYPATTETFGTYTASTNTYVAGAADALNADDWYTEFTQAVVALEAAIVRIGDLRNDLGDRVINRPEDEEELEPLEGPGPVPEQVHRESDVFAEPLIEFPKIEFSLEGIKEPEPPASDDVEVPGLLRVANFAKRTDSVSAFSRHTYSESSFSPRETVSPAFNKDEEE